MPGRAPVPRAEEENAHGQDKTGDIFKGYASDPDGALKAETTRRRAVARERNHLAGRLSMISQHEAEHWCVAGFVGRAVSSAWSVRHSSIFDFPKSRHRRKRRMTTVPRRDVRSSVSLHAAARPAYVYSRYKDTYTSPRGTRRASYRPITAGPMDIEVARFACDHQIGSRRPSIGKVPRASQRRSGLAFQLLPHEAEAPDGQGAT